MQNKPSVATDRRLVSLIECNVPFAFPSLRLVRVLPLVLFPVESSELPL